MFRVPCPTPDGRTAEDLYEKRVRWICAEMQADACARTAADSTVPGTRATGTPSTRSIYLEGDVGLVTEAGV